MVLSQVWQRSLLALAVIVAVNGRSLEASARPAAVFTPHLEKIQSSLPLGLAMRLPPEIQILGLSESEEERLIVRVFSSETLDNLTVSLFTCELGNQPCFVGSFGVDRDTSVSALRELQRHQNLGDRVTLAYNIPGYILEGSQQKPSYRFSSVMWQQNGMIYRVSLPLVERQNILLMASAMTREVPIRRVLPPFVRPPELPF